MKHCNNCNIDVSSEKDYCPLCYNDLVDLPKSSTLVYQTHKEHTKPKRTLFLFRIFLIISLGISLTCGMVNYLTHNSTLWSVLVVLCVVYCWLTVEHTIMSKRNIFEKIFFQLLGIIAILIMTQDISGGGDWLVRYVIPGICMITTIVLVFITFINKNRKELLLSFFAIYLAMIILSIIFVGTKIDTFGTINVVNIAFNAFVAGGTLLFGFKSIGYEFKKNFHI